LFCIDESALFVLYPLSGAQSTAWGIIHLLFILGEIH